MMLEMENPALARGASGDDSTATVNPKDKAHPRRTQGFTDIRRLKENAALAQSRVPLERARARSLISSDQYEAGVKYRLHFTQRLRCRFHFAQYQSARRVLGNSAGLVEEAIC